MMKRLFILFTIFLSYASTTLQAQDNLPQNFSISLGGGVTSVSYTHLTLPTT